MISSEERAHNLLSLTLVACVMDRDTAATLNFMLETGAMIRLAFDACSMVESV
jgi:hypothetical protein